jgi:UDP-GlcNAc3NAcA epimerase
VLSILTVVGARPQFVKAAVLSRVLRSEEYRGAVSEFLVHTGQHYDDSMSEVFFREMAIPEPDANLGVGGGSHGEMTGAMLAKLEALMRERRPDLVLVYGDTNSTLAGALAASKLLIPVAHVEAGLRSFDMGMPEEQNRIVADHLSERLYCPTDAAVSNLTREGIPRSAPSGAAPSRGAQKVVRTGDVMYDASLFYRELAARRPGSERALARLGLRPPFRLLTLHRAENTDDSARLRSILGALEDAEGPMIVFPVHPRTSKAIEREGITLGARVRPIEPVGYFDMLELEEACDSIVTDSGGVQKEALFFGKRCVTLRDSTEWVETVESGWNRLVGSDRSAILAALAAPAPAGPAPSLYGDGRAGAAIARDLTS